MALMQGYYTPRHPEKYVGNVKKIRYMSSWELQTHRFFDNNPNILRWASEGIAVPYLNPIDQQVHKYLPDYWISYKNKNNIIKYELIEVKPEKETLVPKAAGKKRQHYLFEALTYVRNKAKWEAAQAFCNKHGLTFRIITEKQLFGHK